MSFRGIFSRHRRGEVPERSESPLQRCAPPARGSTPTAHLRDSGEVHRDFGPLLESIQSAGPRTHQQTGRRRGLRFYIEAQGEAQPEPRRAAGEASRAEVDEGMGRALGHLVEARSARDAGLNPPPVYGSPAQPSYHSNPLGEASSGAGQGEERQVTHQEVQGSPSPDVRRRRRRHTLTVPPPHQESVLALISPVTIYTLDLGLPSVHVPGGLQQQVGIRGPTPIRPLTTPTTPGSSAHPHLGEPRGFMDWLEQQVYESPSESDVSSNTHPSPSKWEGWKGQAGADEPLCLDGKAAPSADDYRGKGPALELADFISDEDWNKLPNLSGITTHSLLLPQSDKATVDVDKEAATAKDDFKGKGPALDSADFVNDEQWKQMLAFDEFPDFSDNCFPPPPLPQRPESSASGALQNPTRSNLNPAVNEFQPMSDPSSVNSDPGSYIWSSISTLDGKAPEFVPGQIRRMPPMVFRPNAGLNAESSEVRPDDYSRPMAHTAQVVFDPGQNSFQETPRRIRRLPKSSSSSSEFKFNRPVPFSPSFPPQTVPRGSPHTVTSESNSPLRYTPHKGFLSDPAASNGDLTDPIAIPSQAARITNNQPQLNLGTDQAGPSSTVLPPLRWLPGWGFTPHESFPGIDLSSVDGNNGFAQIPSRQPLMEREADTTVSGSSPSPPTLYQPLVPRLRVINASLSSNSSSVDENLSDDPSKLRPSDAEEPEQSRGPEVEAMKDDDVAEQEYFTLVEAAEDGPDNDDYEGSSEEESGKSNKQPEPIRPPSRLSFRDDEDHDADDEHHDLEARASSSSSSSDSCAEDAVGVDTDHVGEFQAGFDEVIATTIPSRYSDPSGRSTNSLVEPFSDQGQEMLAAIRHPNFLRRQPEILRALFMSIIPHPRWQFWEANHLREVQVSDKQARVENVVIARCIAQLDWTGKPILWALDSIRAFETNNSDYLITLVMTKTLIKSFDGKESLFVTRRLFENGDEKQKDALKKWQKTVKSRKERPSSLLVAEVDPENENGRV